MCNVMSQGKLGQEVKVKAEAEAEAEGEAEGEGEGLVWLALRPASVNQVTTLT
jgi:hypothetical protein